MNERAIGLSVLVVGLALAGCSDTGMDEQAAGAAGSADVAQAAAAPAAAEGEWQHPVTEWGDPDLRGMWPTMHLIATQFQRNARYGDRRYLTDEEYAETAKRLADRDARYQTEISSNSMGMGHWAEASHNNDAARLTSMLFYPEDGQFPALTPKGKELAEKMSSSWSGTAWDKPADFDSWDRCVTRGMPPGMFPINYNNGIEIHQAPGYVVIRLEMIHEARIIPIDAEPLDPAIKQWMGESRAHWEDNTLVIETTNFNGKGNMTNIGTPNMPRGEYPTTENMRIVERLTRVDEDTIDYEMHVSDPEVLTSDWKAGYPMQLDPNYKFFEYACHEDNTAVRNYIETSRFERAQRAAREGGAQ
jgi:hypothetical protein